MVKGYLGPERYLVRFGPSQIFHQHMADLGKLATKVLAGHNPTPGCYWKGGFHNKRPAKS